MAAQARKWSIELNNGVMLPPLGFGTSTQVNIKEAISMAIRAGYRHIDTAFHYKNEKEIGEALQTLYKEGVVKREDLFITSKLTYSYPECPKQDVIECYQSSLQSLQTDYLDLYLIHSPYGCCRDFRIGTPSADKDSFPYSETAIASLWESMEELVQQGKVQSIGVSNFSITKLEKLLKTAKIIPAVNQVECHVYFQQPKLRAYLKSKGITLQAYAPIGSPTRVRVGIDPNDPVLLEDPVINEIAKRHQATAAQVCIGFLLHIGTSPIPKSGTGSRIIENMKACELVLSDDEVERIRGLDKNLRFFDYERILKLPNFFDTVEDELFIL